MSEAAGDGEPSVDQIRRWLRIDGGRRWRLIVLRRPEPLPETAVHAIAAAPFAVAFALILAGLAWTMPERPTHLGWHLLGVFALVLGTTVAGGGLLLGPLVRHAHRRRHGQRLEVEADGGGLRVRHGERRFEYPWTAVTDLRERAREPELIVGCEVLCLGQSKEALRLASAVREMLAYRSAARARFEAVPEGALSRAEEGEPAAELGLSRVEPGT